MNKYALYCKETKESFGPFISTCADSFTSEVENKEVDDLYTDLCALSRYNRFALIDLNGSVLVRDLLLHKVEINDSKVIVETYIGALSL